MLKEIIYCTLVSKSQDTPGLQTDQQAEENRKYDWDCIGRQGRTPDDQEANGLLSVRIADVALP
jgi:hypothetical protein